MSQDLLIEMYNKLIENNNYSEAIRRNLYEVVHGLLDYKILEVMDQYNAEEGIYGESFFSVSYRAAFNDMVAHAMKVLEDNDESSTFWTIFGEHMAIITNISGFQYDSIDKLKELAMKLKHSILIPTNGNTLKSLKNRV